MTAKTSPERSARHKKAMQRKKAHVDKREYRKYKRYIPT